MNNKPVAWRKVVGNVTKHYQYNEIGEGEPLYTHPVKELTDEEIEDECRKAWGLHDQDQLNLEEVFKFAKAILKRAQEK
jgi:hypothetical protein